MTLPGPLQTLRSLDRTSPHFRNQLTDFLRGNEYRDIVPSLQGENLAWVVDYLDSVSIHTVTPHSTLIGGTGSLRHLRSQQRPVSGTTGRTQKDMWCQEYSPEYMHTLRFASGVRI